ncbi:methylmalonyl-CoA mutase subunit beta [Bacillus sp. AK031]
MKNASFQKVNIEDWKAKAEESLKGKPLEKLYKETYEGITLKPLYTKEDLESEWMQNRDSSRTGWKVAQRISSGQPDRLPDLLQKALDRGQDTVSFSEGNGNLSTEVLEKLFTIAIKEEKPLFHLTSVTSQGFSSIKDGFSELKGVFSADPINLVLEDDTPEQLQTWLKAITNLKESSPGVKTVLVDTSFLNESGANAVQELAYAVGAGVTYIEVLKNEGWSAEEAAGKIVFNFSAGSSFFMEIAKLRAFRTLWKTILQAYEVKETKAVISSETSAFTKSKLDSYVNMLRAGNEAFSAVLGGADYIHVSPFDEVSGTTSAFSERIARNTQLILSQESHLNKVSDPAGGSYYIESLTNQLAERAWKKFQEIDGNGGLIRALKAGFLQEEIEDVFTKRLKDTSTRKQSLIGTNVYANLEDAIAVEEILNQSEGVPGLHAKRLSGNFESLRSRAQRLQDKPVAGLILLGKIKSHKARADFVTGFLAAGGIGVLPSKECLAIEDAVQFVSDSSADYFVICGRDEEYHAMAGEIIGSINSTNKNLLIDLAGKLNDTDMKKLTDAGLNGSIYFGQQMIEKLDALLNRWEGISNGK